MSRFLPGPILFAVALVLSNDASADVYKCTINGEVKYQDSPCPGSREQAPHLTYEESAPPPAATAAAQADPAAQDEPVEESEGDPSSPAAPPPVEPVDDRPLDRVALLHPEIQAAQAEQRELQRQYREAKLRLSVALEGESNRDAVRRQNRRVDQEWRGRISDAGKRVAALRAELAALCPNGTFMNGNRQECR